MCCYSQGSTTSNVFALYLGVVPSAVVPATLVSLEASIRHANRTAAASTLEPTAFFTRTGMHHVPVGSPPPAPTPAWSPGPHLNVGIFGTTFVFDVLHANGLSELALEVFDAVCECY